MAANLEFALGLFRDTGDIMEALGKWDALALALAAEGEVTVHFEKGGLRFVSTYDGTPCWIKVGP